jgi:hypothetical protein
MHLLPIQQIEELKSVTKDMSTELAPEKRAQFLRVLKAIDWVFSTRDRVDDPNLDDADPRRKLRNVQIMLSHLEKYLSSFDADAADVFADRKKTPVDHRGLGAQIQPFIDEGERGDPLMVRATPIR